jgi:hypothetical protein
MKPRYSGEKGKKFWDKVHTVGDDNFKELASLGVCLQTFEEYVLKHLNAALEEQKLQDETPALDYQFFIRRRKSCQILLSFRRWLDLAVR